jgi:predicted AlkP superfamily phosphohydrolase/phosphomutase/tetratricopeptide (TPR) repeat protein
MNATRPQRVLLIGWDAADWRFIDSLIDAGHMPTLARLRTRSAWGNLSSLSPMLSPILWTTIATGKLADAHGVLGFVEPLPDGSGVRPVQSTSRRCESLWTIARRAGLSSNVVGWYATDPAEPVGAVVSDQAFVVTAPDPEAWTVPQSSVHPPELRDTIAQLRLHPREITGETLLPFVPRAREIDQSTDPHLDHLCRLLAQCASVHAVSTHLVAQPGWSLTCVYHEAIDRFAHEFMQFHPPRMKDVDERSFELYREVMTGCYRFHDMMLDTLLQLAGEETTVVLLSDHGYRHAGNRPALDADPESWHRSHGIVCMAGPGIRPGSLHGASLLDIAPTVLGLLGLPAGRDMLGRVLLEAMQHAPPDRIETHEPESRAAPHDAAVTDLAAQRQAMQQLVELGYLDTSAVTGADAAVQAAEIQQHNLATVLLSRNRPAEAAAVLARLMESHPDSVALRLKHASALLSADQLDAAEPAIASLVEAHPQLDRAVLLAGSLHVLRGRQAQAVLLFESLLKSEDVSPFVLTRLGQTWIDLKRFDRAAETLARAIALDPDLAIAHAALADAYLGLGRPADAEAAALQATALAYHLPRAHFHLARALRAQQRNHDAITALGVCLIQAPNHRPARELLVELLTESGRLDLAMQHRAILAR